MYSLKSYQERYSRDRRHRPVTRYYYPGRPPGETREFETEMPEDTLLVLLAAKPEVIRRRMREAPHDYPIVPESEIEAVQAQFEQEFGASWIRRKFRIDTSELTPDQLLPQFLATSLPHLSVRDTLTRMLTR